MTLELICPWCDTSVEPKLMGFEYNEQFPVFKCPRCGKRWAE